MRHQFSIPYNLSFGESICIRGVVLKGDEEREILVESTTEANNLWRFYIELKASSKFTYKYFIKERSGKIIFEAGAPRILYVNGKTPYIVLDKWIIQDENAPFFTDAYRKVLYGSLQDKEIPGKKELTISVTSPGAPPGYNLYLCGEDEFFGEWDPYKARQMVQDEKGIFFLTCNYRDIKTRLQYKFILHDGENVIWEEGQNREINISSIVNRHTYINHYKTNFTLPLPRICGTVIPLFSIRTEKSTGIGDFGDLLQFIDLMHKTNQNLLQILPIYDTTIYHDNRDSYPYGAISVFALHPIYMNLKKAGILKTNTDNLKKEAKRLNELRVIDYKSVLRLKLRYLQKLYEQDKDKIFNSRVFQNFFNENKKWLVPYALFCHLRDKFKTADFSKWERHSCYNEAELNFMTEPSYSGYDKVAIHYFIQYHLDKQLKSVKEKAREKRVIIKGDLPIGINRNSVDAWQYPHLFNFNVQAGAPPDDFSEEGQNWRFPTYNWEAMKTERYSWWRERLIKMSQYFDAYRIDHVLGFFRIWEIPQNTNNGVSGVFNPSLPFSIKEIEYFGFHLKPNYYNKSSAASEILFIEDPTIKNHFHPRVTAYKTALFKSLDNENREAYLSLYNNYFFKRNNKLWYDSAAGKLPHLISSTGMLACAEDLGMLTSSVRDLLDELKILSLQIERMPKKMGVRFDKIEDYPFLSVSTTSTHDTSTLRGW